MDTTTAKHRTITLTDRPPVRIREDDWPVIGVATGDSYGGGDYARHQQALARGECDTYSLRVRQHIDGRVIVYGVLDAATVWTGSEDRRGGELLEPGVEMVAAIRRVGAECQLPDSIIRECIASLPPVEI